MRSILKIPIVLLFVSSSLFGQDIFELLEKKDHQRLEQEIKNGLDIEKQTRNGLTPLWMAVFKNDTTAVNLLLSNGVDVNVPNRSGVPAIVVGCMTNSVESVKILLEKGADVNWKSKVAWAIDRQPIRYASQGGSVELVKLLLSYGADMESTPYDMKTPLLISLRARKYDITEFYFKNGANVNAVGKNGKCVIHEAIKTKNPRMVELALKYNAPLDLLDPEGRTTWQLAKISKVPEIKDMIKNAL